MSRNALCLGIVCAAAASTMPTYAHAASVSSTTGITINSAAAVSGAEIVNSALRYLGYPYTTVGNSPKEGFSCIGFVSYVYQSNGIPLPDDLGLARQYAPPVAFNALEPGDILFFQNTVWPGISHTAIYLGGGKFIHAEWYNRGVVISSFNNDPVDYNYWIHKYLGANRPWTGAAAPVSLPIAATTTLPPPPVAITTPAVPGGKATVSVWLLNLRSQASKQSPVVQVLTRGTAVSVISRHGSWDQVKLANGAEGWVSAVGLTSGIAAPAAPPPVTSTPGPTPPAGVNTLTVHVIALRVHNAPSLTAAQIEMLHRGDTVTVLDRQGDWVQVQTASGRTGWVSAALLQVGNTLPVTHAAVTTVRVRIHRTPSLTAAVLTVARAGVVVTVLGVQGSWTEVRLPNGQVGYVVSAYLR